MGVIPNPANGTWSTGLCDVCAEPGGCGLCCYGGCCGPCLYGDSMSRMAPHEATCGGNSYGACCGYWMLGGFVPAMTALLFGVPLPLSCSFAIQTSGRRSIKRKYGIHPDDGCCKDCLITAFCSPCALCQEQRELRIRTGSHAPAGAVAVPVAVMYPQAVVMQPGMVAQPGYPVQQA